MNIKNLFFAGILFAAASMSVFAQGTATSQTSLLKRTITKTDKFDFGAGGTVAVIGAPNGSVNVIGSTKNEIEITAVIEVQAANEAELAAIAAIAGFILEEGQVKTAITTIGPFNKFGAKKLPKNFPKNFTGLPFRVDYTISVPRYCELDISGGKGDLSIVNVEGSMNVNFLDSNARVEVIGGTVSLNIGTGSLDVSFGTKGWRGRAATVSVGTGVLTVRLPSNVNAEIDAAVLKTGAIENKLSNLKPRDRKVPFTATSIIAKAGVGGTPLKFTVGEGTMKLANLGVKP